MKHKTTMLAVAALGTLLAAAPTEARRGGHGGGWGHGGPGWGHGGGPGRDGGMRRCGKMLLRAHPEQLKARLGLRDAQLTRVAKIRNNFLHKQIDLRAKVQKYQLALRQLMDKDLPPQNKVLQVMRKKRSVRGVMAEERIKAYLKTLAVLDAGQRKKLREKCRSWGPGRRHWRKGRRGGRGRGQGPGWGPPPPPPPPRN